MVVGIFRLSYRVVACLLMLFSKVCFVYADNRFEVTGYGSLRIGLEHIHAGIDGDGWYWRDYLSRVGAKTTWELSSDLDWVGHIEYGVRGRPIEDLKDDFDPKKRLSYLGVQSEAQGLYFGRQNLLWHQFVRTNYFIGGLDTERQGVLRDDNLLQYFRRDSNSRIGMAVRFDDRSLLSIRNAQIGGQYQNDQFKIQAALISDRKGPATGYLFGIKLWYFFKKQWVLSAYTHNATSNFDEYAGGSSGVVTIHQADPARLINAIQTCANEKRSSYGIYAGYQWADHKVHGRLAADECQQSGEVDSIRLEYIYRWQPNLSAWISFEQLDYHDAERSPISPAENIYHSQFGIRFDF